MLFFAKSYLTPFNKLMALLYEMLPFAYFGASGFTT